MAQVYQTISMAAFLLAGISLAAAIFCWFKFDIHKIIGDLSGWTAKRSIEKMRIENEREGKRVRYPVKQQFEAEKIQIKQEEQTSLLQGEETALLQNVQEGNFLLEEEGTQPLGEYPASANEGEIFWMIQDILLIHTNEII